jgi:hypothetical protein
MSILAATAATRCANPDRIIPVARHFGRAPTPTQRRRSRERRSEAWRWNTAGILLSSRDFLRSRTFPNQSGGGRRVATSNFYEISDNLMPAGPHDRPYTLLRDASGRGTTSDMGGNRHISLDRKA